MIAAILLAVAAGVSNGTPATAAASATAGQTVSAVSVVPAVASTNLPPKMASVWRQAERESRRTADLLANGAIDAAEAARRRAAIRRAFVRVCRHKGLPEEDIESWQNKIQLR